MKSILRINCWKALAEQGFKLEGQNPIVGAGRTQGFSLRVACPLCPLPAIQELRLEGLQALRCGDRERGPDRAPSLGAGRPTEGRASPGWTVTHDPRGCMGGCWAGEERTLWDSVTESSGEGTPKALWSATGELGHACPVCWDPQPTLSPLSAHPSFSEATFGSCDACAPAGSGEAAIPAGRGAGPGVTQCGQPMTEGGGER